MNHEKAFFSITAIGAVVAIAFWGTVAYVAWHFISKFW